MPPPKERCFQEVSMTEVFGKGGLWVRQIRQESEAETLSHPRMRKRTETWDEAPMPKHGALGLEDVPEGWSQATALAW